MLHALVLGLALGLAPAAAQEAPPSPAPTTLDRLGYDEGDLFERADALAAEGAYDRAADLYQYLCDGSTGALGDALVPAKAPGVPFRAGDEAAPGERWEGVGKAVRRRLAAWPRRGLEAWRRRYEPLARGLFESARARVDEEALLSLARRYPFTGAAGEAMRLLGDRWLERGEVERALAAYERGAEDPDARAGLDSRLAVARAALARRAAAADPAAASGFAWTESAHTVELLGTPAADALVEIEPHADPVPRLVELGSPSAFAVAAILPGQVALAGRRSPSRRAASGAPGGPDGVAPSDPRRADAELVRTLGPASVPEAEPARAPLLPPGAEPVSKGFGLVALGAAEAAGSLVAALPRKGDEELRERSRGASGCPDTALYAFDIDREGAILWTTTEPASFGADHREWLERARFAGGVASAGQVAVALALTEGPTSELWAVAFDARAPRVLWRRFVVATPRGRWWSGPGLPRVGIAGAAAVVDTGAGVRAGLDLASGEVLWLSEEARPEPIDARTPRFGPRPEVRHLAPPTAAAGPEPLVVVENPIAGTLDALDPATGSVRWRTRSHWSAELAGAVGPLLVACDREGLWLIDPAREGRAVSTKLPLPPDRTLAGTVTGLHGLLAVPLGLGPQAGARELLVVEARPTPGGPAGTVGLRVLSRISLPVPEEVAAAPVVLRDRSLAVLVGHRLFRYRPVRRDGADDVTDAVGVGVLYLGPSLGEGAEASLRAAADLVRSAGTWSALFSRALPEGFELRRGPGGEVRVIAKAFPLAIVREPGSGRLHVEVEAPLLDR